MASVPGSTRRALEEGCRRFDEGRYFEAHEVWEDAWRAEKGAVRQVLQGLIQVAAAFHKGLVQGRPEGMLRLLSTGLARLDASELELMNLARFRAEVLAWREAAKLWASGGERPALPPPRLLPYPE